MKEETKVRKLLEAIENLNGLLVSDSNALENWQDEIDVLFKAYYVVKNELSVLVS